MLFYGKLLTELLCFEFMAEYVERTKALNSLLSC